MTNRRAIVAVAFAVVVIHNIDEVAHGEDGAVFTLVANLVFALVVVALYPRMARWVRALVLGLPGLIGIMTGTVGHLVPVLSGSGEGDDWTGVLFVLASLTLVIVALGELRDWMAQRRARRAAGSAR